MEFEEFLEHIKVMGRLCLPAKYARDNYRLEYQKAGGGDWLWLSDGVDRLLEVPRLNLHRVYERCGKKFDVSVLQDILKDYAEAYQKADAAEKKEQEMLAELSRDFPEKRVCSILLPRKGNEAAKDFFPGRFCGNVFLMYAVQPDEAPLIRNEEKGKVRMIAITKKMAEKWKASEQELYGAMRKNMPRLFPYDFKEIRVLPGEPVFIISSVNRCYGLGTLFYEDGPLKELAMRTGSDYFVFPLSVHEAAAFPADGMPGETELSEIAGKVSPYGRDIWYYRKSVNRIAFTREERARQEAGIRQEGFGIRKGAL